MTVIFGEAELHRIGELFGRGKAALADDGLKLRAGRWPGAKRSALGDSGLVLTIDFQNAATLLDVIAKNPSRTMSPAEITMLRDELAALDTSRLYDLYEELENLSTRTMERTALVLEAIKTRPR